MRRQPGWTSRDDRDAVLLHGSATRADGRVVDVSVTDISREGCRVISEDTLTIGERIAINVEALANVGAIVRWEICGTAGVRFVNGDWT